MNFKLQRKCAIYSVLHAVWRPSRHVNERHKRARLTAIRNPIIIVRCIEHEWLSSPRWLLLPATHK